MLKNCDLFAYVGKMYYLCTRKLRDFIYRTAGERSPIKQSSAGGLFLIVVPNICNGGAIIWAVRLPACFFSN